jgi:phage terminase large subunit-like protein
MLKGGALASSDSSFVNRGAEFLFQHEYFHCRAESACSRVEIAISVNRPLRRLYGHYFVHGLAAEHEEAMANAQVWRNGLNHANQHERGRAWALMKGQRQGYRDFDRFITPKSFQTGQRQATNFTINPLTFAHPNAPTDFLFLGTTRSQIPRYLVVDAPLPFAIVKPFPVFAGVKIDVHTRDHPPPHVHISIPPDQMITRYLWPDLKPFPGDRALSGKEEAKFNTYLQKFGSKIEDKVRRVWPL